MVVKRMLAWVIDWNLSGLPALIYARILVEMSETRKIPVIFLLLFVLFVFSFPTLFVLRDAIFGGRSIAKRLFRLRVIDKATGELPSKAILIVRNLFFFIYPVDAVVLIVTKNTIGDTVTSTAVVKK